MFDLFLKCSLNKKANALILDLHKITYPPCLSSNIRVEALKMTKSLKEKHDIHTLLNTVRRPTDLEVKFMFKCDRPG